MTRANSNGARLDGTGPSIVLVADSARARLFDAPAPTGPLHEVESEARRIYIVAEPSFLGLLRMRMERTLKKQVVDQIPKALTGRAPAEIRAALPARL